MNRLVFWVIMIAFGLSLAFSQGKPCCKNKSKKAAITCKSNQASVDGKKENVMINNDQLTNDGGIQCPNSTGINTQNGINCSNCTKALPWWKFWAKKDKQQSCCKKGTITLDG